MDETIRRKLRVTSFESIGKTKKGSDIFTVTAVDEEGAPCELELRAFEELPLGEVHEYALKRYFNPKYGESWTMYPPDEAKPKLTDRVKALEGRMTQMAEVFSGMAQRIEAVEAALAEWERRWKEESDGSAP